MTEQTTPYWWYDQTVPNDRKGWTVGETEHFFVDIMPMIYNHRLVLTPKDDTSIYVVGWCYQSFEAAHLASLIWFDPENTEPVGYIKRVGDWPV